MSIPMIKCPKCNHSLVASATLCQFCGADVSQVPRPVDTGSAKPVYKMLTKETLRIFYIFCSVQVLLGLFEVLLGTGMFGNPGDFMKMCYEVFGAIVMLVDILLIFRVPAVYQIASVFCGVEGLFGIVFMIASPLTIQLPGLKWGVIVMGAVQLVLAGFTFYYAEETAIGTVSA